MSCYQFRPPDRLLSGLYIESALVLLETPGGGCLPLLGSPHALAPGSPHALTLRSPHALDAGSPHALKLGSPVTGARAPVTGAHPLRVLTRYGCSPNTGHPLRVPTQYGYLPTMGAYPPWVAMGAHSLGQLSFNKLHHKYNACLYYKLSMFLNLENTCTLNA